MILLAEVGRRYNKMVSTAAPQDPVPYLPQGGRTLVGPLLTERAFARRAGMSPGAVRRHHSIPRISSALGVEPAYPAFMLDGDGLRIDVAFVALLLRRRLDDLEACDWLVRPHPVLGLSPLDWIRRGESLSTLIEYLPAPSRALPESVHSTEAEAIREEWLRFRGDEKTPGWTIAWDRIAKRAMSAPHGV